MFNRLRLSRIIGKPEYVFLVFTIFFGLLFVFLFPPFQVIDEPSHFFRAYQIAQGDIIGSKKDKLTGGALPAQVVNAPNSYARMISNYSEKADLRDIGNDVFLNLNRNKKEFTAFNNTVVYPPFTYLPQAFGIKVSMIFNTPPVISLYFARLFSLIFWAVIIFCLIKIMPRIGKWTIVAVSGFPMILSQAASASSDATINTMTIFTIGIIISIILSDNKGARYDNKILFRLLFICGIFLSLVKPPTVMLLLLALVIPSDKFNGAKSKARYLILLIGLPVAITLLWNYFALKLRVELRPDLSSSQQLNFVLSEPLSFFKNVYLLSIPIQD